MIRCERCNTKPQSLSMSFFNTEMICNECEGIEENHPKYEEAKRVEHEHVAGGNMNFPGIGLPVDLQPTNMDPAGGSGLHSHI